MAVTVKSVGIEELKAYRAKNPTKFAHKYGEVDFDDLPENFEAKLVQYKMAVAKERARRELAGQSQDFPAITPWSFFERPEDKEPVAEKAPAEQTEAA